MSHPQTVNILKNSTYVDDLISGSSNVQGAFELSMNAKEIMSAAGMNLCKWATNSAELEHKWQEAGFDFPQKMRNMAVF